MRVGRTYKRPLGSDHFESKMRFPFESAIWAGESSVLDHFEYSLFHFRLRNVSRIQMFSFQASQTQKQIFGSGNVCELGHCLDVNKLER